MVRVDLLEERFESRRRCNVGVVDDDLTGAVDACQEPRDLLSRRVVRQRHQRDAAALRGVLEQRGRLAAAVWGAQHPQRQVIEPGESITYPRPRNFDGEIARLRSWLYRLD